jgi:hypothetical protein
VWPPFLGDAADFELAQGDAGVPAIQVRVHSGASPDAQSGATVSRTHATAPSGPIK